LTGATGITLKPLSATAPALLGRKLVIRSMVWNGMAVSGGSDWVVWVFPVLVRFLTADLGGYLGLFRKKVKIFSIFSSPTLNFRLGGLLDGRPSMCA
jgi:hypothetical protein